MGSKSCLKFEEYTFLEDATLGVFDNIFEAFITLFHDNEWKIGIIFDYVNYLANNGVIYNFINVISLSAWDCTSGSLNGELI